MERRVEANMTKTEEGNDGTEQFNQFILSCLHSYTRRIAYMPSAMFRYKTETLRNRIMDVDKADNLSQPEPASQLQARIVGICDQDGTPLPPPGGSSKSAESPQEDMKASCPVKVEGISGRKGVAKKRKSKQKKVKPKPVEFLEDDALDDYGYD